MVLAPYPTSTAADQEVYRIVKRYADQLNLDLAPHDLRRTYAKLSRSAGAELEQIQLTLGHQSLSTTERYLGTDLNLKKAPSDLIEITM
ncbi:MAG: site-specific integrase [Anaerolineae bacterium]|nr:site-specific integrase [Anaerolineae bacterium]